MTLQALAEVAGLSMYRLARMFRAEVGIPPYAYQLQLRVAEAKRLLASGRSISRTALDCGFYDQAHLTYQFKRYVGVTPGAYRRGATSQAIAAAALCRSAARPWPAGRRRPC